MDDIVEIRTTSGAHVEVRWSDVLRLMATRTVTRIEHENTYGPIEADDGRKVMIRVAAGNNRAERRAAEARWRNT